MTTTLSGKLEEYRAGWMQRVPAERRAVMERHIAHLAETGLARNAKASETRRPTSCCRTRMANLSRSRRCWCPYCSLELRSYQDVLPRIAAAGASLVAISPEKPDDSLGTTEKNALSFTVLSDVGQKIGKAFGLVYSFTDELRAVYDGFKLDIPEKNGTPDDWSLPLSATYAIGESGRILFADTSVDYRRRTDPLDVLQVLETRVAAE